MNHRASYLACAFLFLVGAGCSADASSASSESEALAWSPGRTIERVVSSPCPHPGQVAVAEECNAFDDDCDGAMDEGVCDDPCNAFDEPVRSR